jgi:hypothetical protein
MLIKVLVMQKKFKNSIDYMRSKGSDIIDYLNEIEQQK